MSRRIDGHKRAQWSERLTRFTQASLSISEFCRSEGVTDGSFYYWRRKLAERSAAHSDAPVVDALESDVSASANGRFLPVQVTRATDPPQVEFAFPNGASMRFPSADRNLLLWAIESVTNIGFQQGES